MPRHTLEYASVTKRGRSDGFGDRTGHGIRLLQPRMSLQNNHGRNTKHPETEHIESTNNSD